MTTINYPELRYIENEQIRVYRLFMGDPQPKYIQQLVELKRRWDAALNIAPFVPTVPPPRTRTARPTMIKRGRYFQPGRA